MGCRLWDYSVRLTSSVTGGKEKKGGQFNNSVRKPLPCHNHTQDTYIHINIHTHNSKMFKNYKDKPHYYHSNPFHNHENNERVHETHHLTFIISTHEFPVPYHNQISQTTKISTLTSLPSIHVYIGTKHVPTLFSHRSQYTSILEQL